VCLACRRAWRKSQPARSVACAHCGEPCEYVHWKIRVPSPKRERAWRVFWKKYLAEKHLIAEFLADPAIERVELDLLNQVWLRERR